MDFDNPEIAKLQEQIRLLQLENNILKQNLEELEKKISDNVTSQITQGTSQPRPKSTNIGKSNCACKGNCSSRICGCVKKNNKCNSSCKCNNASCQNQVISVIYLYLYNISLVFIICIIFKEFY